MSVIALSRLPRAGALQLSRVSTAHVLVGVVAISFVGRLFGAWARATPTFFPDEYLYAELGRSVAEGNLPLVRGVSSGFPSLLHPLLTAPFWLIDDVETAFRAIQAFDAAAMSMAAIPVYAIARQLGITRNLSLVVAAAALLGPDLLLAGWLVAEPLAYPLLLAAVWATIRTLERPSASNQLILLALLGLTTIARLQLVVVALASLATIVLVGARERRLRRTLREHWLVLGSAGGLVAAGAALLIGGKLGVYSGLVTLDVDPLGIASWAAPTALLLVYASGWLIVPGALIGLALGLARPRGRAEAAFAIVTLLLTLALLAEAGFISESITGELHERYVFYLVPLVVIWFVAWLGRGTPGARWHAAGALGLATAAVWVPVSRLSAGTGKTDAPFLRGVGGLEEALGDPGTAATIVAAACLIGSIVAIIAQRSGAKAMRVVLAGALAFSVASTAFATGFDRNNSLRVQANFLGNSPSWVDRLDVSDATLLWGDGGRPAAAHEALFWNRAVRRVALLPAAHAFDNFAASGAEIAEDGTILNAGTPLSGWVLVNEFGDSPAFATGTALGGDSDLSLHRFESAPARLSSRFEGRHSDGFLAGKGRVSIWPASGDAGVSGTVTFTVRAPAAGPDRTITFTAGEPGTSQPDAFVVRAGAEQTIVLDACATTGPWQIDYKASPGSGEGSRVVTLAASPLEYVRSPRTCS